MEFLGCLEELACCFACAWCCQAAVGKATDKKDKRKRNAAPAPHQQLYDAQGRPVQQYFDADGNPVYVAQADPVQPYNQPNPSYNNAPPQYQGNQPPQPYQNQPPQQYRDAGPQIQGDQQYRNMPAPVNINYNSGRYPGQRNDNLKAQPNQ